jgi:hypothetical protein
MTAICRNGCKAEEGWSANFKTERVTLQQWEVTPDGYWVAAAGEEHVIAAEHETMWICTKCGSLAYHVNEKAIEIIKIINNLGYTGPDVIDTVYNATKSARLASRDERNAEDLAEIIANIAMPAPVSSVRIEYVDDGTRHNFLVAEVENPDDLQYGFTDEDIFFFGMTPLAVLNAYNKQIVCEGEWRIIEVHGLAHPVEYASNYAAE